jgi:hypothetical protein
VSSFSVMLKVLSVHMLILSTRVLFTIRDAIDLRCCCCSSRNLSCRDLRNCTSPSYCFARAKELLVACISSFLTTLASDSFLPLLTTSSQAIYYINVSQNYLFASYSCYTIPLSIYIVQPRHNLSIYFPLPLLM